MNYRLYKADDFVTDPFFRSWILDQDAEAAAFWAGWQKEHPDRQEELDEARATLYVLAEKQLQVTEHEVGEQVAAMLGRARAQEQKAVRPVIQLWYRYAGIAAMAVLVAGLGWMTYRFEAERPGGSAPVAGKYRSSDGTIVHFNRTSKPVTIALEDGSRVTLNPQSELKYPEKFAADKREVHLKGEAFFQISRNPERPFLVLTKELVTRVLGTSFTVRSFEHDRNASVSVKTGRVSVYSKEEEALAEANAAVGVVLKPNQGVLFDKEEAKLVKVVVEAPVRVSEVPAAALVFDEMPVKNVFNTLEEEYGIEVVFDEEKLSACQLTANLSGLPMYEQLDLICRIIHAKYEVVDGRVVVYGEGCKSE